MSPKLMMLMLLLSTQCFAQELGESIKNWKPYPIPVNKDTLISYNRSGIWWNVWIKDNEPYVVLKPQNDNDFLPFDTFPTLTEQVLNVKGKRAVLKVNNGYLVGMDYGEWGGDFSWYSNDGKSHKKISGQQILKFLTIKGHIYALDGYKSIIEVEKDQNEWLVKDFVKLPQDQTPVSFAFDEQNNFIVISSNCLFRIDQERKISKIIENGFWQPYLYPTSMVIKNNVVYVGMPMGLFKYDLSTEKSAWLMPR